MQIYEVTDPIFREYGKIIEGIDFSELAAELAKTPCPKDSTVYAPGDENLEKTPAAITLSQVVFGEMPVQVGYCNGNNHKLNALEYHRNSEINYGTEEFYLILGKETDITPDLTYDTSRCVAFHVPAGVAVEVYATTLHYAPCSRGENVFHVMVALPLGTNTELKAEHKGGEDGHLTAVNKWLLGHPEGGLPAGSPLGLVGENLTIE